LKGGRGRTCKILLGRGCGEGGGGLEKKKILHLSIKGKYRKRLVEGGVQREGRGGRKK